MNLEREGDADTVLHQIDTFASVPWVPRLASTLLHFIWQGALIAGIYGVIARWPGRHQTAPVRYSLACAALLVMVLAPVATFAIANSAGATPVFAAIGKVASPSAGMKISWNISVPGVRSQLSSTAATAWIVFVWLVGAFLCITRLAGGWIVAFRVRSLCCRPAPDHWQRTIHRLRGVVGVSVPVLLRVSSAVHVPTVLGWLRPVILIPVSAMTGLTPDVVEAVLLHELAHIRRHDYLINLFQSFVEAVLFYHPAVWWVSKQIRDERELCCDDIAAQRCGDRLGYARALAELELCRSSHLAVALAANGGSLKNRISRLLKVPYPHVESRPWPPVIAVATIVCTMLVISSGRAQQLLPSSSLPSFEVASIKASDPDSQLKIDFAPGGRLFVTHATLRFLMKIAYDVSDDQIIGGPAWISSTCFDVQGKPATAQPGDPQKMTKDELLLFHEPIRLRLQRLLADRFHLELRKESKPMPIFGLVAVRSGAKMKADAQPGDPIMERNAGHGSLRANRVDMDTLARFLSEGQVGRPVVNMTGIVGKFDFRLDWTPDPALNPLAVDAAPNQSAADQGGISIFTALQQQLGLKLEARTGSADALVVVGAQLPSPN